MNCGKYLASLLLVIFCSGTWAFPLAPVNDLRFKAKPSMFHRAYDFSGIVKLSNCSGSLVILEGQNFNAKAMVLTNGHCVPRGLFGGMIKPGEVVHDKNVRRRMTLYKDLRTTYSISSTKLLYATMTDTDLALYELSESYQEIYNRTGISPLLVSSQRPYEGTQIEIISGYWERGYGCSIDQMIYQLREGGYTFTDSIRYTSGCDTKGGTSGSPIIDAITREVIGVNNTGNESGRSCTDNNPCEINQRGEVQVQRGARYGQQTFNIYTCLNNDRNFSLYEKGCVLPK